MKILPRAIDKWEQAKIFAGDNQVYCRVTVEESWYLTATPATVGSSNRGPFRWWQSIDNDQTETIIPNVTSVSVNRSVDTDSGTMDFEIENIKMDAVGVSDQDGEFGKPGYYGYDYGVSPEAAARWAQTENEWNGVLVPNALFRVYVGYANKNTSLEDAIADEDVTLYGVFLADSVDVNSNGRITISCRDMGKLLIEQKIFPPLIPMSEYPLEYRRWNEHTIDTLGNTHDDYRGTNGNSGLTYVDSSGDRWYGGCFDEATEVLTKRGWQTLSTFKDDDEVLGIDPETKKSEWQTVNKVNRMIVEDHEMIKIDHINVDALVTPDHRWMVKKPSNVSVYDSPFHMVPTRSFTATAYVPRIAELSNVPSSWDDDFVELVAWIMTEGTFEYGWKLYQSFSANPIHCTRIENLLEKMFGPNGAMSKSRYHKDGDPLWSLSENIRSNGAIERKYSLSNHLNVLFEDVMELSNMKTVSAEFISSLTFEQSKLFVEICILADGYQRGPDCRIFTQKHYERIMPLEMAAIQSGYSVATSFIEAENRWLTNVSGSHFAKIKKATNFSSQLYTGTLWSPSVKHENFMVRRNGRTYFTGNSGSNASIHGHRPSDSLDGNLDSFALSVGNSHPSRPFCTDFFAYKPDGPINGFTMHAWGGNYTLYVAILENGIWQTNGQGTVTYDHTPLLSSQPSALNPDTGADKPYVAKFSVPWETSQYYELPRTYDAEQIMLIFRDHTKSQWGPWYYRVGIRELTANFGSYDGVTKTSIAETLVIDEYPTGFGYRIADDSGFVTALGEATLHFNPDRRKFAGKSVDMDATESGLGYWTLSSDGLVNAFGDAELYTGSVLLHDYLYTTIGTDKFTVLDPGPPREVYCSAHGLGANVPELPWKYNAIVGTPSGNGYWLIGQDYSDDKERIFVEAHGDAPLLYDNTSDPFWDAKTATAAAGRRTGTYSLWIGGRDGVIHRYGGAVVGGNITLQPGEDLVSIVITDSGSGYHLLGSFGSYEAVGDATDHGDAIALLPESYRAGASNEARLKQYSDMAISSQNDGGWLLNRGGEIFTFGNAEYFGTANGTGLRRTEGSYRDYADIIKDLLLWSGWYLYDDDSANIEVFGGIESTGAHAGNSVLGADFFDKRPVIDVINELKEIVGFCVDESTQIMTRSGWKYYTDLVIGEEVYSINPDTQLGEWKKVTNLYVSKEKGLMTHMKSRNHDSLTTGNHNWLTYKQDNKTPMIVQSSELKANNRIPIAAEFDSKDRVLDDGIVELCSWYFCEGYFGFNENNTIHIAQSKEANPDKWMRIYDILKDLLGEPGSLTWNRKRKFDSSVHDQVKLLKGTGFTHQEIAESLEVSKTMVSYICNNKASLLNGTEAKWRADDLGFNLIRSSEVVEEILGLVVGKDKSISLELVHKLTADQARLFTDISILADGSCQTVRGSKKYSFYQKSDETFERWQMIAAIGGQATSHRSRRGINESTILRNQNVYPIGSTDKTGGSSTVEQVEYDGVIWCPTVEDNHTWLAKREGNMFFTGNCFFIDSDGGAIFRQPNWWQIGNYDQHGNRITYIPEIDERTVLIDYSVGTSDDNARSEIIVSSQAPENGNFTTQHARVVPPGANLLRGIVKPAFWTNSEFSDLDEAKIMAELISLHIWFQRRQGSVTIVGNPCLTIDSQVRIIERVTAENYVHYLRGIADSIDLKSGKWTQSLQTHWLGDRDDWVITRQGLLNDQTGFRTEFSATLQAYVEQQESAASLSLDDTEAFTYAAIGTEEDVDGEDGGAGAPV